MQQTISERFLRLRDVMQRVSLSRTTIYRLIGEGGRFPAPVKLGERASAWTESSITEWINQRIASSEKVA
jgi:prophage regulatory protein